MILHAQWGNPHGGILFHVPECRLVLPPHPREHLGLDDLHRCLPSWGSSMSSAWPGKGPQSPLATGLPLGLHSYTFKRGVRKTNRFKLPEQRRSSVRRNASLPTSPPLRISSRWSPLLDLKMQTEPKWVDANPPGSPPRSKINSHLLISVLLISQSEEKNKPAKFGQLDKPQNTCFQIFLN